MEPIYAKFLSYVIDMNGQLDPLYARKIFANTVLTSEFFYEYDAKANTFTPTEASLLFDFSKEQFHRYDAPATVDSIVTEVMKRSELSTFDKERINEALIVISQVGVVPNDFEYSLDCVIEAYTANKTMQIMQRGTATLKNDPRGGVEYLVQSLTQVLAYQRLEETAIERTLTLSTFAEYLKEELQEKGSIMSGSVSYPYLDANRILGGMAPGELIVIAGPSGSGKSFIGHDIAYYAALSCGLNTVCADREMLHPQNGLRFLSRQTQIPSRKLRNKRSRTDAENQLIDAALEEYVNIISEQDPLLFIPPKLCANTYMIRREIDKHWGTRKPDLIIADYLTEFEPTIRREGWEEVRQVTHDLKQLGLYYACPVVTMAQINQRKEVQYRTIKHICDTLLIIEEDADQPYVPPKVDEFVGSPGIIHCTVDKARNEAHNVGFSLEIEFATASVQAAPEYGRTAIGRELQKSPYDQDEDADLQD